MDIRAAILLAALSVFFRDVIAATYYLSTSGSDGNSCAASQSAGTPKATFSSAWGCLSAGDTLVVADGTHTSTSPRPGRRARLAALSRSKPPTMEGQFYPAA